MLNFINKKGKKVMELKDDGDLTFVSEELKATGLEETIKEEEDKEDE